MVMASTIQEGKVFATFEKHNQFLELQNTLLNIDLTDQSVPERDDENDTLLKSLLMILYQYHEQSYLLDPYLENLVTPVVDRLKYYAKLFVESDLPATHLTKRMNRVANLLYYYINFRGYKSIVRFFPHEIADLTIALDCMFKVPNEHSDWPLRYVMLIWLYLICMIPFDLSQFDESDQAGGVANQLENLAKFYLEKAGLEGDGAALLLSRLYMRKDTRSRLPSHLHWTLDSLKNGDDVVLSIGALQVICQVTKDGPVEVIRDFLAEYLSIVSTIDDSANSLNNTHIRKMKYKLSARVAIRLLPPRRTNITRGKLLVQTSEFETSLEELEQNVPTVVEDVLQQLFEGLQDRDTIVRWSAAKGVARIAERLPAAFAEQVLETVMGLFAIHSTTTTSMYDLPSIAESTWHGACLACAEVARRGLVSTSNLSELIDWLSKALYFDLRKGAHSIGSNVRDAAAYVLWSLARTQTSSALAPYAESLAHHLVTVSLFDREVHVRRAASAAFQEFVGRTVPTMFSLYNYTNNLGQALFPAGIDVLRKTDFYAVSVRRNAFLEAALQVSEHKEYRTFMTYHLLNVTLRHWDATMRELSSQSLHHIILTDFANLSDIAISKSVKLLDSVDIYDMHGGLLALTEIAKAYDSRSADSGRSDSQKDQIFDSLSRLADDVVFSNRYDIVTAAACRMIASTLTSKQLSPINDSRIPRWKKIVEFGLKHRNPSVQEAAAEAMRRVSLLQDCTQDVKRYTLIQELMSSYPNVQQSLGLLLGMLRYDVNPLGIEHVVETLLDCVTPAKRFDVEARRTCYQAMTKIVTTVAPHLKDRISARHCQALFRAMLGGLNDYTNDERGDVGSWIRITCIKGLSSTLEILFAIADIAQDLTDYLPPDLFKSAIAGILKQGLERLDNVRQVAGECFVPLLNLPPPVAPHAERWMLPGKHMIEGLLLGEAEPRNWSDGSWFFPKAVRFLEIADYRDEVLSGIVMSMGSKTDSIQRPMTNSLIAYVKNLPTAACTNGAFDVISLIDSLTELARRNFSNNNIVVPIFQTFNILLENNTIQRLSQHPSGLQSLQAVLEIVMRNISRIKSIARVHEAMKIVINLLTVEPLSKNCTISLKSFFLHNVPKIRMDAAEYFYLALQTTGLTNVDEIETIVLETEWMSSDQEAIEDAFKCIQGLLANNS
ncbi:hypothetical protein AX15_000054 [Amanita polypyramis BW_CC]|nr:hypothetical protein AX15_000054 [Amanita polypyramis BW_CC]